MWWQHVTQSIVCTKHVLINFKQRRYDDTMVVWLSVYNTTYVHAVCCVADGDPFTMRSVCHSFSIYHARVCVCVWYTFIGCHPCHRFDWCMHIAHIHTTAQCDYNTIFNIIDRKNWKKKKKKEQKRQQYNSRSSFGASVRHAINVRAHASVCMCVRVWRTKC